MAASDDPLFLGLQGDGGREFRLDLTSGRALRRGQENRFVLAGPDDPETNVKHPDLNDPTSPPIDAQSLVSIYVRKGLEPIPNVRALAEMDDRLEIVEAEIEIHVEGGAQPIRFRRTGAIWLGLVSGLRFEIARVVDGE